MARTSKRGNASKSDKPRLEGFENGLGLKNVSTDALQKSLRELFTQLAAFEQDQVDLTSIDPVKATLIDRRLMLHKDKGVKAYVCVCLAEILRVYAPEAPYTQDQLADIFQFFFRQLANLTSQTAYYDQYHHLLESLSEVKSIVLVCDLDRWDEVITDVFKDCFTIVRKSSYVGGSGLPRKLEMYISDILAALLDEAPSVPETVLELLLSPFSESHASSEPTDTKGKLRDSSKRETLSGPSPQHRIATQVLNATKDKLQRNVGIYFTDIIVRSSSMMHAQSEPDSEASDDETGGQLSRQQMREVEAAHLVIRNLHASCPGVLTSVVPQLEEELRVEDLGLRGVATSTLGRMYTDAPQRGAELIRSHPTTWSQWMSRKNDKSAQIRHIWAGFLKGLILVPSTQAQVQEAMSAKMLDPDEKVRLAVIQTFEKLDYETALRHVDKKTLDDLAGRGLDKKHAVRHAALHALGRLWDLAYPEIASNDPQARNQFGWIPGAFLGRLFTAVEVRSVIEEVVHTYLFPLPTGQEKGKGKEKEPVASQGPSSNDEGSRTDRLLDTLKYIASSEDAVEHGLHEESKLMDRVMGYTGLRLGRPTLYNHYINAISSTSLATSNKGDNKEEKTRRLANIIRQLTVNIGVGGNGQKVSEDLHAFADLGDQRLVGLLRKACEVDVDVKALAKATGEFQKRLHTASPGLLSTMNAFLRKGSLRIVNQSSIPSLLKTLRRGTTSITESQSQMTTARRDTISPAELAASHARAILLYAAKWRPELYSPHLEELLELFDDDSASDDLKEVTLRSLSVVAKNEPDLVRNGVPTETHNSIRTLVLHTTNWRLAKYGARYLAFAGKLRSEEEGDAVNEDTLGIAEAIAAIFASELEKPVDTGEDAIGDEYVLSHVTVLAQFSRFAQDAFEARSDVFVRYMTQRLLMMVADEPGREEDQPVEWIEDSEMSAFLRAKLQAIKALRHRCLSYSTLDSAIEISTPVFRLLTSILDNNGSVSKADAEQEDPRVLSRLRLQAVVSLIHICTVPSYSEFLNAWFVRIAVMVQDPCFEVRYGLLQKLVPILFSRKLPHKYNVIPFLTAVDPESEVKTMASGYVSSALARMSQPQRLAAFELIHIRFLEVLSQHPDFALDEEKPDEEPLRDFAAYINMYIALVLTQDNISLLYNLVGKGKTVKTKVEENSEKFWQLCELSLELMKIKAHREGWNINNFPGRIRLPQDIFSSFPDNTSTNENLKKVYLPDEMLNWLQEQLALSAKSGTKRKAGAPPKVDGAKKTKTKRRKSNVSDDEDGLEAGPSSEAADDGEEEEEERKPVSKKRTTKKTTKTKRKSKKEDDGDDDDGSDFEVKPSKAAAPPPKPRPRPRRSKPEKDSDVEMEDAGKAEDDDAGAQEEEMEEEPEQKRTTRRSTRNSPSKKTRSGKKAQANQSED